MFYCESKTIYGLVSISFSSMPISFNIDFNFIICSSTVSFEFKNSISIKSPKFFIFDTSTKASLYIKAEPFFSLRTYSLYFCNDDRKLIINLALFFVTLISLSSLTSTPSTNSLSFAVRFH